METISGDRADAVPPRPAYFDFFKVPRPINFSKSSCGRDASLRLADHMPLVQSRKTEIFWYNQERQGFGTIKKDVLLFLDGKTLLHAANKERGAGCAGVMFGKRRGSRIMGPYTTIGETMNEQTLSPRLV